MLILSLIMSIHLIKMLPYSVETVVLDFILLLLFSAVGVKDLYN